MKTILKMCILAVMLWGCKKENIVMSEKKDLINLGSDGSKIKTKLFGTWVRDTNAIFHWPDYYNVNGMCNFLIERPFDTITIKNDKVFVYKYKDSNQSYIVNYTIISDSTLLIDDKYLEKFNYVTLSGNNFTLEFSPACDNIPFSKSVNRFGALYIKSK